MKGNSNGSKQVTLKNLSLQQRNSFVNGPFGSNLLTSELTEVGVPVVYIRDIRNGFYKRKSQSCVTTEKAKQLESCKVVGGDILVAKVGDPPRIAAIYPQYEPDAVVTQDVIRLRLDRSIAMPEFVCYYTQQS